MLEKEVKIVGILKKHYKTFLIITTFIFCLGFSVYTQRFVIDFWFFLKNGEFIFNHKFIPKFDPFSFGDTTYWLNHHWLSDFLFYLIYKNFSFLGLQIFKTIIGFLTLIILFKTTISSSKNLLLSSFLIILASCSLNYFFTLPKF